MEQWKIIHNSGVLSNNSDPQASVAFSISQSVSVCRYLECERLNSGGFVSCHRSEPKRTESPVTKLHVIDGRNCRSVESEKPEGGESCLSRPSCHILGRVPRILLTPRHVQIIQDTRAISSLSCPNPYWFLLALPLHLHSADVERQPGTFTRWE